MANFDKIIDRHGTNTYKWDALNEFYGREDLLSMWVADMDFESPKIIIDKMKERLEHGIFGYTFVSESFKDSVRSWLSKRHGWKIKEGISVTPGVVPAINLAIRAFSHPGDKVIVQTPVYYPFFAAIENTGRHIVRNPLKYENGKYFMDFEDLKSKIDTRTKILILCNPHNPVGRVWTKPELEKLAEICIENNILIVSDEIHSDIVRRGQKHIPIASISPEISEKTISCYSVSKTFNLAGLQTAVSIITNPKLNMEFQNSMENVNLSSGNIFGLVAMEAAYRYGEEWLEELLDYLDGNYKFLKKFVSEKIPRVKVTEAEGTYLVWLDFSELGISQDKLNDLMVNKAKVALDGGEMFGEEGIGFMRINIGCPRKMLEEGLNRIAAAIE